MMLELLYGSYLEVNHTKQINVDLMTSVNYTALR